MVTVSRLSVRLSVTVSRLSVTVSRLSVTVSRLPVSVTTGLLWGIPMRVQLLLSILASQSDMAIIIRSKGTHVLVYGACSILLRLITLSMQVTPIGAREHLLNF